MNIIVLVIIGFVVVWWIVQLAGRIFAGRKIDDPFQISEADASQDK